MAMETSKDMITWEEDDCVGSMNEQLFPGHDPGNV